MHCRTRTRVPVRLSEFILLPCCRKEVDWPLPRSSNYLWEVLFSTGSTVGYAAGGGGRNIRSIYSLRILNPQFCSFFVSAKD